MASSMNGMFPGQQPPGGHPVGGAPGPSQPSFPGTAPRGPGNNTLVDELEASFEACFSSLVSQDYVNGTDQEEIRTGVDQCIQKFLDVARQTECFFLQKRLQLSVQKPEQVLKEDLSDLRNELQRKELLVQKHLGKLHHWQQVLEDVSGQHRKPTDLPRWPFWSRPRPACPRSFKTKLRQLELCQNCKSCTKNAKHPVCRRTVPSEAFCGWSCG